MRKSKKKRRDVGDEEEEKKRRGGRVERNEEICHVKLKNKGAGKWQRDRKGAGGKNRGGGRKEGEEGGESN